jgi:nicotinate phosphoribosyltransferase
MVYKLVARGDEPGSAPTIPEAKTSGDKATVGHRKRARRRLVDGVAVAEELFRWDEPAGGDDGELRDLQVEAVRAGEPVHRPSLDEIREHHRRALAELPPEAREVTDGAPVLPTRRSDRLADRSTPPA